MSFPEFPKLVEEFPKLAKEGYDVTSPPSRFYNCISWAAGYDKIAIYGVSEDDAKHAAKQIGPNQWSSKVGDLEDITHTLEGLVGDQYGMVMRFMRRPARGH